MIVFLLKLLPKIRLRILFLSLKSIDSSYSGLLFFINIPTCGTMFGSLTNTNAIKIISKLVATEKIRQIINIKRK